ncbi:MAG TPA: DNA polymerase III subunit epsilon [Rhizomicrobium sp.]|jgi:DNA polymerase-3 subunit epsilon|nr:DNA polymerase III subunit epsilon [Rhizomicrobium sp.]
MREIVLDTETTGLDPNDGHRVIDIGCVELMDHFPTGRTFQCYLNPERDVPPEVQKVHGITTEFLADKPLFAAVVDEFLEFIGDAPLVIHNAGFDLKFLNAELHRLRRPPIPLARAIDTIEIAKSKLPGARYSLDELCRRFNIDLASRTLHGALLDSQLTAQLYLELVGGRQKRLLLSAVDEIAVAAVEIRAARARPAPLPPRLTPAESQAHAAFVAGELGADAVWGWG